MAYCPKCGVSVEKDQVPCPLCFTYIPKIVSDEELLDENGFPTYYSLYENLVNFFIRVVYRVLCVLMILGFLIPTLIDVILNKALT
ncbi:small multidrug resistance protein, partial [Terribacillus saccharophilus]|nr:small multidrug resistance protein [Terribacillus saccharophilus]